MLTYLGNNAVKSLAADNELAEIFTPNAASAKEKAAKNRQDLLDQFDIKAIGSHSSVPYRASPAEEAAIPMKAMKVKMMGSIGTYISCHFTLTLE